MTLMVTRRKHRWLHCWLECRNDIRQEGSTSSYKVSGYVAGVLSQSLVQMLQLPVVTLLRVAASYNMGNGLTLSASSQDEDGTAEDDSHSWLLIR